MGTATRSAAPSTRSRGSERVYRSTAELREVLDRVLRTLDEDQTMGPSLRAAGLRIRFQFPDRGVVLNLASAEESDHHIRWEFSDRIDWQPKFHLTMDSPVANRYLQGEESLAIAIARGEVRYEGASRVALSYVPAGRLICRVYRDIVRRHYPHLLVT